MSPVLAAFLTLVLLGLPQMLMGQGAKGLVMLCVGMLMAVVTAGFAILIILPVGMIDAYCIAQKLRSGKRVEQWEFF